MRFSSWESHLHRHFVKVRALTSLITNVNNGFNSTTFAW